MWDNRSKKGKKDYRKESALHKCLRKESFDSINPQVKIPSNPPTHLPELSSFWKESLHYFSCFELRKWMQNQ